MLCDVPKSFNQYRTVRQVFFPPPTKIQHIPIEKVMLGRRSFPFSKERVKLEPMKIAPKYTLPKNLTVRLLEGRPSQKDIHLPPIDFQTLSLGYLPTISGQNH